MVSSFIGVYGLRFGDKTKCRGRITGRAEALAGRVTPCAPRSGSRAPSTASLAIPRASRPFPSAFGVRSRSRGIAAFKPGSRDCGIGPFMPLPSARCPHRICLSRTTIPPSALVAAGVPPAVDGGILPPVVCSHTAPAAGKDRCIFTPASLPRGVGHP